MREIKTREIGAQQVLTEVRYGTTEGLPDWIGPAIGRGLARAAHYGGMVGPVYVVFHGEITPAASGTVEVCLPVALDQDIPLTEPHRYEPAHTEAYTRLRKRDVKFPEILDGYDAVKRWVDANGHPETLAPREVYFTDFMNAADDDEVTDVAFVIAVQ